MDCDSSVGYWTGLQVRCMECRHQSNIYEIMMDLAVEIQGNVGSLEDALRQFTAPEILDGENKYKCGRFVLCLLTLYVVVEEVSYEVST